MNLLIKNAPIAREKLTTRTTALQNRIESRMHHATKRHAI